MKNNIPRGVVFGFLSWFLPLGLTFVGTPLIVYHLGAEEYGLYALVLGFVSYSFTFSVGRTVTKFVAEYHATEKTEKINDVLGAALRVSLIFGAGGALILILISRWLVADVFQIQSHMQEKAVVAFYIAAGTVFFHMLSQVFSAVLQAMHRFDLFSHITTTIGAAIVIGNIALVLLGYNSNYLLFWNLTATAVGCLVFYLAGRKLLPEARWSLFGQSDLLSLIAKFAVGTAVSQLLFNFLLLFERGIITRMMGSESLTYYVVPMNLTTQIHAFSASLVLVVFPLASELGARMETERLQSIYRRVNKYICALVVFLVVTLSVCGHDLLSLWLNAEFADKARYILVMQAISYGAIAVGVVTWFIMEGFGQTAQNAIISAVWTFVSIFLMLILTPIWKLEGVGAGRMIGCVVMLIYILLVEKRIFGKPLWGFWLQVVFSLSVAACLAAFIEHFWLQYFSSEWLGLITGVGLGGIIFVFALIVTRYLTIDERRNLQGMFLKALPIFSGNR